MKELKVGIIGGGQLGAMTIAAGIKMGLDIAILDVDEQVSAARFTAGFHRGDPMNYDDVVSFGKTKDILTYEKEAVNTDALSWLKSNGVTVYPKPEMLVMIQDKWLQKEFLLRHYLPTANGCYVADTNALKSMPIKYPACLKLCRGGYDGRGVMILKSDKDIDNAFAAPCVLEDCTDIDKEISIVVARSATGEIRYYDPVQMTFNSETHVLEYQQSPASITAAQYDDVCRLAVQVAGVTELVGVMAVEMFIDKAGKVLINELAPRVHNSGHHTIEAAATSQFEQHLRAVLGLPLGDVTTLQHAVMINVISNSKLASDRQSIITELLKMDHVDVHWYGKPLDVPGRKVGHVTITGNNMETIKQKAKRITELIK